MSESITSSKNRVNILYIVIGILLIAIAFLWTKSDTRMPSVRVDTIETGQVISDGKRFPISLEAKKFLQNENYQSIILVKDDARIKLVGINGIDEIACGAVIKGKIMNLEGQDCQLDSTDLLNLHSVTLLQRTMNSWGPCKKIGGTVYC